MSQSATSGAGGGTPDAIKELEEVIVRGSRYPGHANPKIDPDTIRGFYDRAAANDPFHGYGGAAANDPLPADEIEEVLVTGKKPPDYQAWLRTLLTFIRRGGIGAIGIYDYPDWLISALQKAENDLTEETLIEDDEIEDSLRNPDEKPGVIEEIEYDDPLQEIVPPDRAKVDPKYSTGIEEVKVIAKPLKHGHGTIVTFPWRFVENYPIRTPRPIALPGYRPTEEYPLEPYPQPAPTKPPKINPDTPPQEDDAAANVPATNGAIEGSIALTIDPNAGVRLAVRRRPARNREENKVRRDRKEEKASRRYRQVLMFVNRTYGEWTELQDLWQVIAQNIYIDGKPLYSYKNPAEALKNADDWSVNWEGLLVDYAAMQATDIAIGRLAGGVRDVLNDMGYYGPNPGSYLPKPPSAP